MPTTHTTHSATRVRGSSFATKRIDSASGDSGTRSRPLPRDGNPAAGRRPLGGTTEASSASEIGVCGLPAGVVVCTHGMTGAARRNTEQTATAGATPGLEALSRSWKNAVSKPTGGLCCRDGHSAILRPPRVRVRSPARGVWSRTVRKSGAARSGTKDMSETENDAHGTNVSEMQSEEPNTPAADGGVAHPLEGHPTAETEIDELQDMAAELTERRQRLARGEIDLPWPRSSTAFGALGVSSFFSSGALLVHGGDMSKIAGLIGLLAGFALVMTSRWVHRHFEVAPEPSYGYPTDEAADPVEEIEEIEA